MTRNRCGIAKVLARHGAYVVLTVVLTGVAEAGKDTARSTRKDGLKAKAFRMDVTKKDEVNRVVQDILEKFSRMDILVNNAGIYPLEKSS